ncbi:hypothetical protein [Sutterella megalosphaeroides]|uniref:Uncharacterized protein n=1 Tax=Sutterella megalosphaeroides TaxID=2494234 RepID=A0A2Z6IDS0_9BURK|nr:hypothetical protein [Sutterella megalosphaeroides]BBF22796.1 hypothetical protein SUTMEG_06870 [Sutterella megalosphaeroides]
MSESPESLGEGACVVKGNAGDAAPSKLREREGNVRKGVGVKVDHGAFSQESEGEAFGFGRALDFNGP